MGDQITDLSERLDVPPLPLKTYQWEDIRRQKLEGRYPWTHLYKPQFDKEKQFESKEHEYEPVIPMNALKNTSPVPALKITADKEICTNAEPESPDMMQDKRHLCIPDDDDGDESDEDDSDEITAEELQQRLEERYFKDSASSGGTKHEHEHERSEAHSVSPTFSSHSRTKSDSSLNFQDRVQTQAEKLKRRLKDFKEHISKERCPTAEGTPRMRRKISDSTEKAKAKAKAKPVKKNKFNFRKRNAQSQETHSSNDCETRSPRTSRRRFSLPRLPSFSRSRSSSVKERASCTRSHGSEADSRKFFSYPRVFNSCKSKKKAAAEEAKLADKVKARSAPPTPSSRRQSPFSRRWVSKFIDHKREDKSPTSTSRGTTQREESGGGGGGGGVVAESIFISLHEDGATNAPEQQRRIGEAFIERESTKVEGTVPSKVDIDEKNFIFISLHEERFPEKLKQLTEQQQEKEVRGEEREIERELQQARTARKFHSMLRRMQNECKAARACRAQAMDDEPEPVVITEVTDECADQLGPDASYDIEQPTDELFVGGTASQSREFERQHAAVDATTVKARTFREQSSLSEDSLETGAEGEQGSGVIAEATYVEPARMPRSRRAKNNESRGSFVVHEEHNAFVQQDDRRGGCGAESTSKTYIKADLERSAVPIAAHDHTTRHFIEYERALEKSRSQSSFEIENNFYSTTNSLARMETPVRPARPTRVSTLAAGKKKRATATAPSYVQHKENYYDLDATKATKPEKPRRKFREKRTYSNSTTATELEDETISNNIVNAKQLSVSFLPLSSNLVGEPIVDYNLRETSSMIHLNLSADPPLPPKRAKSRPQNNPHTQFSSLPNRKYQYHPNKSPAPPHNLTDLPYPIDADIEYADDDNDVSSTGRASSPPKRPYRRRNTSLTDDCEGDGDGDESLSYAKTWKDAESRTTNDYAVIESPPNCRQECKIDSTTSIPRRISRRLSDFFTIPRLRAPTNYVPQCASQTLDNRRCPSPSRPPRRPRHHRPPNREREREREHLQSEGIDDVNQQQELQLDFRLATERETPQRDEELKEDLKSLETHDIFERMKSRPLPPPPRPTRKAKEDQRNAEYSECVKRKPPASNERAENESARSNVERRTANVDERNGTAYSTRSTWHSWERRTTVREFEITPDGQRRPELSTPVSQSERGHTVIADRDRDPASFPFDATAHQFEDEVSGSNSSTRCADNELLTRQSFCDRSSAAQTTSSSSSSSHSNEVCPAIERNEMAEEPRVHHIMTAAKLNVSELNVGRMSVSEIESTRLVTSNVESSSVQLNDVRTETGHVIVNSVNYSQCMSTPERCQLRDVTTEREGTPMSNEDVESAETASVRSRISSMVPEIGSEDECAGAGAGAGAGVTVRRPNRRKHQAAKRELVQLQLQQQQQQQQQVSRAPAAERNHATLAELMSQIIRICYSSVGEALNSLFESVIPEDRDKRNEVHAAIWVITIIVAGCLMLGLQSNEKVVHHHHWDFHFPPPH